MRYHSATLALANAVAAPSADSLRHVAALERRLRIALPTAFRDLVTSTAYPELLAAFSNNDQPIPVDLLHRTTDLGGAPPEGVLTFMVENQGVARWGIELVGDDPRVLVQVDGRHGWRLCADSFEVWLWCQVFDLLTFGQPAYAAQAEPLSHSQIRELEARFEPGPRTFGWPGETTYRFRHSLGSVLLWSAADQCDWWVTPRDLPSALDLLRLLPVSDTSRRRFYALSPAGRPALDLWRSGR